MSSSSSPHNKSQGRSEKVGWELWKRRWKEVTDRIPLPAVPPICLPLARIKKIMKADEDVRMIAAEAPVVFARACEMFILDLTHRSWAHAEENKRRTLQKNDIAAAITRTDVFDFLVDIVPREDTRDDVIPRALGAPAGDPLSYYYVQQ
ncbi:hypothetical protein Taro_010764 [Colocasia esculenta]|uniref:Transcription factor CBF/NF-Y/archaeal histone domain-containing protein n=1 Tax=Colocasia esculenta TaxID=4460 RepID=A0A843U941_COLES|nr:hypothetical protein [Colocasia esculenta]